MSANRKYCTFIFLQTFNCKITTYKLLKWSSISNETSKLSFKWYHVTETGIIKIFWGLQDATFALKSHFIPDFVCWMSPLSRTPYCFCVPVLVWLWVSAVLAVAVTLPSSARSKLRRTRFFNSAQYPILQIKESSKINWGQKGTKLDRNSVRK